MGNADNRKTLKMRKKRAQKKLKDRIKDRIKNKKSPFQALKDFLKSKSSQA